VPLPLKRELSEHDLAQLHASGLSDETIALAGVYTEPNQRTLSLILERPYPRACGPALVFPLIMPGATEPHAYRIKPLHPRTEKKRGKSRVVKYDQASRAGMLVYYAPRARAAGAYGDPTKVCLWTEGEKKSLALDQLGLVCVGLTGVWSWSDPADDGLHPSIRDHVTVAGREHVICFDGDSREKKEVMHAAARLAGMLLSKGAVRVSFVCPPPGGPKGVDDFLGAHGADAVHALLATAEVMEGVDPKRPRPRIRAFKAFADAPLHKEASLPDGYDLRDDGSLWKLGPTERTPDVLVSPTPLFIQRQFVDQETNEGRVSLCWRSAGAWIEREVSQLSVADARSMVAELSPFCVPVVSTNAARTVEWLYVYEHLNAEYIAKTVSFSHIGWQQQYEGPAFVLQGPELQEDKMIECVVDTRGQRGEIFEALTPRGALDVHVAALRRAWAASPVCATVICGALAAPLLHLFDRPNFGIHLIGESSRGKTTMLKIAASVYGDPNNPLWVAAWNTTNVGAELRASVLCDMPLCYDEVGGGDPTQLERLVYSIINGTGRTRGQRDVTLRKTSRWQTIMLSTGEKSIVDETAATGAQVRVVELPVDGFGELNAQEVDALKEACAANCGKLGRAWVSTLVNMSEAMLLEWKEQLAERTEAFRLLDPNPLQQRVAGYYALLSIAEEMAGLVFGLGEGGATMERVFAAPGGRTAVQGLAERSHELVDNWVMSEPDSFPALVLTASGDYELPYSSRHGLRVYGFRREDHILFIPSALRAYLRAHRFSAGEVIRQWALRGWTRLDTGRTDARVRVGGRQIRFVALHAAESE
jgi:Domain of unknown function (DUF927)/Domain of unknown function (DUF3854)